MVIPLLIGLTVIYTSFFGFPWHGMNINGTAFPRERLNGKSKGTSHHDSVSILVWLVFDDLFRTLEYRKTFQNT